LSDIRVDVEGLWELLLDLLRIPSPSGYTDHIVHHVVDLLTPLGCRVEVTRRGAIRACFEGRRSTPARALVSHLDTTGAIVCDLKDNGRLALAPIGTWSSRFAEGARVTVFSEAGPARATVLPLKASGRWSRRASTCRCARARTSSRPASTWGTSWPSTAGPR
jgi:putative aminopeptidase FrvX